MSDRLKSRFTRPTTTSVRSAIIAPVGWYIGCCVCFRFLFYGWRLWCCMIEINHVRCLIDRHAELHVHRHVASPSVAKHCVSTPFFYKAERTYVRRQWDVGRGGAGNDVCLTATLASGLFMNSRSFVRSFVSLSVGWLGTRSVWQWQRVSPQLRLIRRDRQKVVLLLLQLRRVIL